MSWLTALQDYVAADTSLNLTVGTTLFAGDRPDDAQAPNRLVALTPFAGGTVEHFGSGSDIDMPGLQGYIRSAPNDFAGGWKLAWDVRRRLNAITEQTIGDTRFLRVAARITPRPLGKDSAHRFAWVVDWDVWLEENASVEP